MVFGKRIELVFDSDTLFGDLIEMFWSCLPSIFNRILTSTVSVVHTASHCDSLLLHYYPVTDDMLMRRGVGRRPLEGVIFHG